MQFLDSFNHSNVIILDNLKTANVIPIFKKDNHTSCNNYRSTVLLCNVSKVMEKLKHSHLITFLNSNKIQFGFRHNHSTAHALSAIMEEIRQACDLLGIVCL